MERYYYNFQIITFWYYLNILSEKDKIVPDLANGTE